MYRLTLSRSGCFSRNVAIGTRQIRTSTGKEDLSSRTTMAAENFASTTQAALPLSAMPGPSKHVPYFGTFFTRVHAEKTNGMGDLYLEWLNTYGPVYQEKVLGKVRVYVSDADNSEKVCRAEGKFPAGITLNELVQGVREAKDTRGIAHGLADAVGEEWAEKRRMYGKRLLRPVEMKNYFSLFAGAAVKAVDLVKKERRRDNVVLDHKQMLVRWSMDSFSAFVFGKPMGFMEDPPSEDALAVHRCLQNVLSKLLTYKTMPGILRPFYAKKYFHTSAQQIEDFHTFILRQLQDILDRSDDHDGKDGDQPLSFSEYLMGHDKLSLEDCATSAADIFGGGYDTTTTTMSFFLYVMGKNPDKQELLYKEICDVMPENGVLDYSTSQRMPYLRACVKESQRMFPLAMFVLKSLEKDITLNGYVVPKLTPILINNYGMGNSEDLFPNASEFKPERWLRTNDNPSHPFAFLPFGTGVRSCIGRRIAEGNMYALIAQYFKTFRIDEVLSDLNLSFNILLENKNPLDMRVVDRK